ncbi:hypothetical protein R2A130_3091 [Ahrensia sp. R2A130]|nr:hypothetical protein R2A130_3091 [Ahrensia sp. R2A130]
MRYELKSSRCKALVSDGVSRSTFGMVQQTNLAFATVA